MKLVKILWGKWLGIARPIGNFQGQLLLSIFYIFIFWPVGILYRILADPFKIRGKNRSTFSNWEYEEKGIEGAKKQY